MWCTDFYFVVETWKSPNCNNFPACIEFLRYFAVFIVPLPFPHFKKINVVYTFSLMSYFCDVLNIIQIFTVLFGHFRN